MKNGILLILVLISGVAYGQMTVEDMSPNIGFVIVYSTENFEAAKKIAINAADQLNDSLVVLDKESDFDKQYKCGCGEMHDRMPRGRYDDGTYISVERGDDRHGFTNGIYLVVVGSGYNNKGQLSQRLEKAKKIYPDSYLKSIPVYHGCMH